MWFFGNQRKQKPKVITEKLKKSFDTLDFSSPKKLSSFLKKLIRIKNTLIKKQKNIKEKLEKNTEYFNSFDSVKDGLEAEEIKLAKQLENLQSLNSSRDNTLKIRETLASLNTTQFKLKTTGREHKDYKNTDELLSGFNVDINDAINVLSYMISTLERNLERLNIVSLVSGDDIEYKENNVDILGIDFDMGIVNQTKNAQKKTIRKIKKLEKSISSISKKLKIEIDYFHKYDSNDTCVPKWWMTTRVGRRKGYGFFIIRKVVNGEDEQISWKKMTLCDLIQDGSIEYRKTSDHFMSKLPDFIEDLQNTILEKKTRTQDIEKSVITFITLLNSM